MSLPAPKVAILLATRNGEKFLPEQLESYRLQSYPNWDLHASDDGSTDGTVGLIETFGLTVAQRVAVHQGPRQGFWQNFMSLVHRDEIDADLLAFSDQDDIWNPQKLEVAVEWFKASSDGGPALYFSRTELIKENGPTVGLSPLFTRPPSFRNALVQNIGGGNTMMFNRAARDLLRKAPADVRIVSHDWWTYQLISGAGGATHYDPWPSVKYRQHGRNLVGANAGFRARLARLKEFSSGRLRDWNNTNIEALRRSRALLTSENGRVLDLFAQARQAGWLRRAALLRQTAVYRQSPVDNVGMLIGLHLDLM
ncbi:glycosyltransferase family 2 protein [Rhodopseudomonas palustris]|uniref:glycosyltransferase family 2 protein n=1 Tax=Rhodopseudomonas palustris TaxID=1076 RepID=UPI0021F39609|nr:glycosyltransferase family 2 protein [Rhodopseudomonas palustris]UYO53122.1 glycosyltransferase family 2 protein [Rhodopseudomonas palustris]